MADATVTTLRERLAQMGETAMAATPGEWRQGNAEKGTVFVQMGDQALLAPSLGRVLVRINPHFDRSEADAEHIATFSPDVAAALVAVADALRNAYDVGAVAEWIDVEGDGPKAALDALAAALGVSR